MRKRASRRSSGVVGTLSLYFLCSGVVGTLSLYFLRASAIALLEWKYCSIHIVVTLL